MSEYYSHRIKNDRTLAGLWMSQIADGLAAIGNGGVPLDKRLHTAESWDRCDECRRVAREVAYES